MVSSLELTVSLGCQPLNFWVSHMLILYNALIHSMQLYMHIIIHIIYTQYSIYTCNVHMHIIHRRTMTLWLTMYTKIYKHGLIYITCVCIYIYIQGSPGPVRVGCACSGRVRAGPGSGPGSVGSHGNQYKTCLADLATAPKSKELLRKLVVGAVDEIQKAANEYKTCLSDPTIAPQSKELLQKRVFGAADEFPKAANEYPKRACQIPPQPREAKHCSKSLLSGLRTEFQKQPINRTCASQILPQPRKAHNCSKSSFSGAVDGIPQAANDRSYHSPEKHTIAPKARFLGCGRNSTSSQWQILPQSRKAHNCSKSSFRGCGRNSTSSRWQIPPQPRKAKNCSKSSFSGLCTEFHKQPMTDPTTAPKSTQLLQKLVFGAVDGIPQAANEEHTIAPWARSWGCGRNSTSSQWQIPPQPRKAHNCSKSLFSGLWAEFHKEPMTDPGTARKGHNCSKSSFSGLWTEFHKQQWQILPQPRKVNNCCKSSFSGIWTEFHQAANDRSYHSSEKQRIAPKARFRGCGRICHWLLVEFRPQPRRVAFGAILCLSGLWSDLSVAACGIPSTAPKTNFWSNCSLFGTVAGSVIGCLWIPSTAPKTSFCSICLLFGAVVYDLTSTLCIH